MHRIACKRTIKSAAGCCAAGGVNKPPVVSRGPTLSRVFSLYKPHRESRRADLGTADLRSPVTSLLEHVLASPGASEICACLGGFRCAGANLVSVAYRRLSVRLQYAPSLQLM